MKLSDRKSGEIELVRVRKMKMRIGREAALGLVETRECTGQGANIKYDTFLIHFHLFDNKQEIVDHHREYEN